MSAADGVFWFLVGEDELSYRMGDWLDAHPRLSTLGVFLAAIVACGLLEGAR